MFYCARFPSAALANVFSLWREKSARGFRLGSLFSRSNVRDTRRLSQITPNTLPEHRGNCAHG